MTNRVSIPRHPVIDDDCGVLHHRNETQDVFRFHETILSFGEPGSLGHGN